MGGVPHHRYLVAYLGETESGGMALLRFPLGVTLEDAGYDWWSSVPAISTPTLPAGAVERLRELGVEVAVGPGAGLEAIWRARAEILVADHGAFVEDYLSVNARLGGERCVTIVEYAMDTWNGGDDLRRVLRDRLSRMGGVRMYGDAGFREGEVPDVLRLRVWNVADNELSMPAFSRASCDLHGGMCGHYRGSLLGDPGEAIMRWVPRRHLGARVALPRRLLDELHVAKHSGDVRRISRAALPVVRRVLEALPEEAKGHARLAEGLVPLVAMTVADTCEEHAMIVEALRDAGPAGSVREMVRRARNRSWAVSRALENLRDRW